VKSHTRHLPLAGGRGTPTHKPGGYRADAEPVAGDALVMAVVRRTITAFVVLVALLLALGIGVGAVQQSGVQLPVRLSPTGLSFT
jgi:hypothetical protein